MLKNITHTFFFGNIFYGICAVALSIETNMLMHVSLNSFLFYSFIFFVTVFFYLLAYLNYQSQFIISERDIWYNNHQSILKKMLLMLLFFILLQIIFLFNHFSQKLKNISFNRFSQLFIFPTIAMAYSFNILPFSQTKNLRKIGLLKPFIVGFVWSGMVSIFPIIFLQLQNTFYINLLPEAIRLHFFQNFLFISTLCVLFDMKDIENDTHENIKTFVVQLGFNKTIYYIVIPLIFLTLLTTLQFNYINNYTSFTKILLSIFPLLLTLLVSFKINTKTHLLYYLWAIDGLMLIKAICSIIFIKL